MILTLILVKRKFGAIYQSKNWHKDATVLWNEACRKLKDKITEYDFFYEQKNLRAIEFATSLGAKKKLEHSILNLSIENLHLPSAKDKQELRLENYNDFIDLHDSLFPNTYLSGEQIVELLNTHHKSIRFER